MANGGARREYERLFAALAAAGAAGAGGFFDRTPREIEWEMRALAERRARRAEELAALGWMTGRYVALGVNAPRKYPAAPPRAEGRARTDGAMKDVFISLAKRRKADDA